MSFSISDPKSIRNSRWYSLTDCINSPETHYHSTFELSFYSMYYCEWHKNDFPPNAVWWEFSSCAINQCISWFFLSRFNLNISVVFKCYGCFWCKILYGLCGKSQKCSLIVNWNYKFVEIKRYCFKIICWNATSYCRILF